MLCDGCTCLPEWDLFLWAPQFGSYAGSTACYHPLDVFVLGWPVGTVPHLQVSAVSSQVSGQWMLMEQAQHIGDESLRYTGVQILTFFQIDDPVLEAQAAVLVVITPQSGVLPSHSQGGNSSDGGVVLACRLNSSSWHGSS